MTIKMPTPPAPKTARPANDERVEAFIQGGHTRQAPAAAPAADPGKTVVNSRWNTPLLQQIDQAAKKQGISRTAWLHVAAAEKLAR